MVLEASPFSLNGICFRLRMISVASSTTPVIDWNSCSTPSIRTAVTAAPSIELSSVRRRALPIVVPKPRSNGWALNLPKVSVSVSASTARRFGFWNPLHNIYVSRFPRGRYVAMHFAAAAQVLLRLNSGDPLRDRPWCCLLRVKFDDQLLVDRQRNVLALG